MVVNRYLAIIALFLLVTSDFYLSDQGCLEHPAVKLMFEWVFSQPELYRGDRSA